MMDYLMSMYQIYSMDDITEESIIHGAQTYYERNSESRSATKYHFEFEEFTGIDHVLRIQLTESEKLHIKLETKKETENFKLALQLADDTVIFIEPGSGDCYDIPDGNNYLVLCGYNSTGDIYIGISEE